MLNKKNSSSNIKRAIFAGALAASTAAVSDQVNTVVTPTQNGVTATASGNGTVVSGSIGKSSTFGSTANIGVATKLGESGAIAINIEKGADMQRFLGSLGFSFKNGNLIFSGEQLSAKGKYMFTSGELEESMKQNKAGVALKLKLSEGFFNSFVMDGSITKAQSKEFASKEVIIDTATTFAIYDNLRRIAGGEQKQASAGFIFRLGENTRLELKGKYETLDFDTRYSNNVTQKQAGGEGKFTHVFNNGVKFDIGGGTSLAGNTVATGVQIPVGKGTLGFEARGTQGINGNKANNYVGLTYNLPLGEGERTPKFSFNNKGADYSNIVADVVVRNNAFASQTLLTKADEKMQRRVEVDKTNLPAGTNVINSQGDIEISSLNVLSIASITKDGSVYTNAGEFTLASGKLRIIPKTITAPVAGDTDTYVVSVNLVGGGSADVTVVVEHGSVIVRSIIVQNVVTNTAPVSNNDSATTAHNTSVLIDVLANDTDAEGNSLQIMGLTQPASGGSVAIESGKVRFTPTTGFSGTATFTYLAYDGVANSLTQATVTVIVNAAPDTVGPVITLTGTSTINMTVGGVYTEAGATAVDAVDGTRPVTITGNVNTAVVGTYTVTYTSLDTKNNTTTVTRTVNVNAAPDTVGPVITLNGASTINMTVGGVYIESGATALDAVDGTRPVTITGNVNTAVVGTYTVTYTSLDTKNNTTTVTRTVNVNAAPNVAPVALDGSVDALSNSFVNIDFSSLVSDDTTTDNALTFEIVSNPENLKVTGTFPTIVIDNSLSGFAGNTFVTYRVIDANGLVSEVKRIDVNNIF